MRNLKSVIRLQAWLSPAFPTGAFSYSCGLEAAIELGLVVEQQSLFEWLSDVIESGSGWNDAILLAESWRSLDKEEDIAELIELAHAISFSKERFLESVAEGDAFLSAARAWDLNALAPDGNCPLPVSVGLLAAAKKIDLRETLVAYLHAYSSNQIQAAMRLMKLGQQGALELLASLEDTLLEVAVRAAWSTRDDLGGCTILADIAAMNHETMESRIFRS